MNLSTYYISKEHFYHPFLTLIISLAGWDTPSYTLNQINPSGPEANKIDPVPEYEIVMTDIGILGGEDSRAADIK